MVMSVSGDTALVLCAGAAMAALCGQLELSRCSDVGGRLFEGK
jgi:hypothetical protein